MKIIASGFLCFALAGCSFVTPPASDDRLLSIEAAGAPQDPRRGYPAMNLIDKTWLPWATAPGGTVDSVTFTFAEKVRLSFFYIKNGFGLEKFFLEHGRARRLKISSETGDEARVTLGDTNEISRKNLWLPVRGKKITFTITDVYKGEKFDDTCISEILFEAIPDETPVPVPAVCGDCCGPFAYLAPLRGIIHHSRYTRAQEFTEGLAPVCIGDNRCGFIDAGDSVAVDLRFSGVRQFSEGLAFAESLDKDGKKTSHYINKKGREVVSFNVDALSGSCGDFHDGIAVITARAGNDKGGYDEVFALCDTKGKIIARPEYRRIRPFSEGLAAVQRKDTGEKGPRWGYIGTDGGLVLGGNYSDAKNFSEGLAAVTIDNSWHYIDITGKIIISCGGGARPHFMEKDTPGRDDPGFFSEGHAVLTDGTGCWFVDKAGAVASRRRFTDACGFSEGLAAVKTGEGWGYMDHNGDLVIPPRYAGAFPFKNGLARVVEGRTGVRGGASGTDCRSAGDAYIDKKGRSIWRDSFL